MQALNQLIMTEPKEFDAFRKSFVVISKNQATLRIIYDETIGLVNDIAKRSKTYMLQISDIEDGLFNDEGDTKNTLTKNLKSLTSDIHQFNSKIGIARKSFNEAIYLMIEELKVAIMLVSEEKGNKNELKRARRVLRYLDALIRRFKVRINQLQLMNNILFIFSQEMKLIQDEYKQNLRTVNAEMSSALEQCDIIVKEIDRI